MIFSARLFYFVACGSFNVPTHIHIRLTGHLRYSDIRLEIPFYWTIIPHDWHTI